MAYVGKAPQTGAYQILDDISGSFTGSTPGPFNLTVGGTAVLPGNEASCIISISGVVQQPVSAFTISGSQITFTGNPASSDTFFGVVLGNTFDIGTPTDSTVTAGSLASTFFVKNAQTLSSLSMFQHNQYIYEGERNMKDVVGSRNDCSIKTS